LFITHDRGVVADTADRVAVMYAGRMVEAGDVTEVFDDPRHAYTVGLMRASPRTAVGQQRLNDIPGSVPELRDRPSGCTFSPRCAFAIPSCQIPGAEKTIQDGTHLSRCIRGADLAKLLGETHV
jgi:oligopeptide/dipeptide ABC transporter ATP-binding protein